ncbi:MgtC/SapB family protein [Thermogemmatispora sp.]|uniref:MgtC/SapB family protein n=1 Tax=Thermogemmatispora sp. TaxID=1968838 RepID=UPI0035E43F92
MGTGSFLLRLLGALVCGVVIGTERQARQRAAGLRTSALVATGSAIFTLAATFLPGGNRLAAQVVSGVGVLCAGVILRTGMTVRGLNTAGTLWCVAATGVLAGLGQLQLAWLCALLVVGTHLVLRPVGHAIDRRLGSSSVGLGSGGASCYELRVMARQGDSYRVRSLVCSYLVQCETLVLWAFESGRDQRTGQVLFCLRLGAVGEAVRSLEWLCLRLSLLPEVLEVSWAPEGAPGGDTCQRRELCPLQGSWPSDDGSDS